MAADYHIFEGLTIRNADIAFQAGLKDVIGAKGLTVRNCRIEDVGIAVNAQYSGSQDFYIADNVMIGRDDRYRLLGWYNPGVYGGNRLKSYYAVKVYGSGHVVSHNYIAYFHDGISVCTHGSPDPEEDHRATAIDFYNNDIHLMADDFIEADGGVHNIRIMRNRGVNAGQCGLSAQPVYGGPAYYIRNVLYHVPTGCGLKFNVKPAGMVLYHNTIIAEALPGDLFSNTHFRNNLFLGTDAPDRSVVPLLECDVLLNVRLQRLPPEPERQGSVPLDLTTTGSAARLRARPRTSPALRVIGRFASRNRARSARSGGGLRRFRESTGPECRQAARGLQCA